uniref:Uncharacterized protein n=1 Tax=Schistocephalus solidus TaxID=70667 RepID=A0A0X3PQH9_SCHSO
MDDVTLINALSVYQEGEWKRLLALRQSVKASLTEWSKMSQIYMDFVRACDPESTGQDRCLKSTHFEIKSIPPPLLDYFIDRGVANSLRSNGALNLPSFLRTVEALFRRLRLQLCRGTTESSPSTSSQTEATDMPSSDILWCLRALRRASQDCSDSSTNKSVVSVDASLPRAVDSTNLSGESCDSLATEAADVSSTLTLLTQKLRLMVAQEEVDWCPSPLTFGREGGLSAEDSVSLCYPSPQVSALPHPKVGTFTRSPSTPSENLLSPNQALCSSPLLARTILGELPLNLSVSSGCSPSNVAGVERRVRQLTRFVNSPDFPLDHSSSVMASPSFDASAEDRVVSVDENDGSLAELASVSRLRCSSHASSAVEVETGPSSLIQFSPFGDRLSPTFQTAVRQKQARAPSPVAGLDDLARDCVRSVGEPSKLELPLHMDSDSQCSELSLPSYLLPSSPLALPPPPH